MVRRNVGEVEWGGCERGGFVAVSVAVSWRFRGGFAAVSCKYSTDEDTLAASGCWSLHSTSDLINMKPGCGIFRNLLEDPGKIGRYTGLFVED